MPERQECKENILYIHCVIKNTAYVAMHSFIGALPQFIEVMLFRNGHVSALRSDYIINIYFILCAGVG